MATPQSTRPRTSRKSPKPSPHLDELALYEVEVDGACLHETLDYDEAESLADAWNTLTRRLQYGEAFVRRRLFREVKGGAA